MEHQKYLKLAIGQAVKSFNSGGFPAGTIIVKNGKIISEGLSTGLLKNDPTEHGEVDAIKKACFKLETPWIDGAILYSSMEPCLMCLGACGWSNISEVYFACTKEVAGNDSYLGSYKNEEIINSFGKKINLHYIKIDNFEKDLLEMIKIWETNTFR